MKILIAGANGKIGRHLVRGLAKSDHICRAMVRDPAQEWELRQLGADEVVVVDLEGDCRAALISSRGSMEGRCGNPRAIDAGARPLWRADVPSLVRGE